MLFGSFCLFMALCILVVLCSVMWRVVVFRVGVLLCFVRVCLMLLRLVCACCCVVLRLCWLI